MLSRALAKIAGVWCVVISLCVYFVIYLCRVVFRISVGLLYVLIFSNLYCLSLIWLYFSLSLFLKI